MLATMTGILLTLTATGATQWHDAWEVKEGPIQVEAAGTYTVWTWVYKGESPKISVADTAIEFEDFVVKDDTAQWVSGTRVSLDEGPTPVTVNEGVASVVLTTKSDWDPAVVVPFFRVSDDPEGFRDERVYKRKGTNTVFKMTEFESREDWEAYAERLRRRILISSGLWPEPPKTALNAKIFGRIQYDDYSVEKVHFEAAPGFLVTGNLYRPAKPEGKVPGVACPHGHWEHGRLEDGERGSVPARGITLAKMGMVAFTYDMVGYNDSLQLGHRWESEAEKLWGIHPFGLQLLSSIRVLDFLETLPEVDPERLACTGASGGGTQTFALAAVDPRVKVAAPVNMISSTMQGGCVCENAPLIRLDNSNMEIGALMAPRPMLMVSATGDWTKKTPEVEYPAVRSIYELYDAEDQLEEQQIDAPHNYNQQSREAMYRFFGKHLLGGDGWEDFTEPPYELEEAEALRVFPDGELPEGYLKGDALIAALIEQRRNSVEKFWWSDDISPERVEQRQLAYLDIYGIDRVRESGQLSTEMINSFEHDGYRHESWVVGERDSGEKIPIRIVSPLQMGEDAGVRVIANFWEWQHVVDLEGNRSNHWIDANSRSSNYVRVFVDPFWTGEHRAWHQRKERSSTAEGFYDTFEATDTMRQVKDFVTALTFVNSRFPAPGFVSAEASTDVDAVVWIAVALSEIPGIGLSLPFGRLGYLPSFDALGGIDALRPVPAVQNP